MERQEFDAQQRVQDYNEEFYEEDFRQQNELGLL